MAAKDSSVLKPNFGLYTDRPTLALDKRALRACQNVRIKEGRISNLNLGWEVFGDFNPLNGPVNLIDNFFVRSGAQTLIFGTTKDLYTYSEVDGSVTLITPTYNTATVDVSAADPAVVTTNTGTPNWDTNLKAGDMISFGATDEHDPDATWYEIASVDDADTLTLTAAVAGAPLTASDYTARVLFSGNIEDFWVTDIFFDDPSGDDVWYATNGVDDIVRFVIGDTEVTLLDSIGFTCKTLAVFKSMMIYGNVTDGSGDVFPSTIINSDVGDPEEVSTGLAGQFIVHDGVDPIETLEQLGDNLVVYSQRNATLVQFIGSPLIFAFRVAVAGLGPLAGRLVADFGDFHEFLGSDSMYRFDGVTLSEVGYQVFRDVIRGQDPARRELGFTHFDEENGDLIWCIPLAIDPPDPDEALDTPPSKAYVSHYLEDMPSGVEDPITYRDFPFTCSGFFERQATLTWDQLSQSWQDYNFRWNDQFFLAAFPFNLVGDADGVVYTLNTAQSGNGTALVSYARTGRRALGDGRMRGLLTRVYPFARPYDGDLTVTVYLMDHAAGNATITDSQTFDENLAEGGHFTTHYRRGRFFELEFRTEDGTQFELDGWDFDARVGGRR